MYFSDGSVYEGPFDENVLYGHGVYKDKDLILKKEVFNIIN